MSKQFPKKIKRSDHSTQISESVRQVIEAGHSADTDPLGSYTGFPVDDPFETPVQDADDL